MKSKVIIGLIVYNLGFVLSGAVNWPFQLCAVSILTLVFLSYFDNKIKWGYLILGMLPAYLLYSITVVTNGFGHVYPIVIFPVVICALYFVTKKFLGIRFKLTALILSILFFTVPTYFLMEYWLTRYFLEQSQKDSAMYIPNSLSFKTKEGQLFDFAKYSDTLYVLDYWSTSCGVCFKKLPMFKLLEQEYSSNSSIKFFTVNIEKKNKSVDELDKRISGFFSHNLFLDDTTAFEKLNIEGVPYYMIVRNGEILFRGNTNIESSFYQHDLVEEIEKYIKR